MYSFYAYIKVDGAELFTSVCLPEKEGKYPTVIFRAPYVDDMEEKSEEEIVAIYAEGDKTLLENGFATVHQHCRGRGKSTGDCIPYIYEREDGLSLHGWVREQSFYNGSLYLVGGSYTASVHYVTAPFASDIKGAVLSVQDSERYNCNYRNGFYKMGLHGDWYVSMYKRKGGLYKTYTKDAYRMLPLSDFSRSVFGENAADFDEILRHPDKNDPFWTTTRYGGAEAHNAAVHANIPILFTTGFYDIYTGGVFDMWFSLDKQTRAKCALAVNPYDHGGAPSATSGEFPDGTLASHFGNYTLDWLLYARDGKKPPFETGKVTYYKLFSNVWCTDTFEDTGKTLSLSLGSGEHTYRYNPYAPACFKEGLSCNFGGTGYGAPPNSRYDIISIYTEPFEEDTVVKGKMNARIKVKSDCPDTCFYMRVYLATEAGDYGLRDDITKISNFNKEYREGDTLEITFSFDEHAFLIKKGERIRVDISSSAFPQYVPHTNTRGLFSEQTVARVAQNTVILTDAALILPVE